MTKAREFKLYIYALIAGENSTGHISPDQQIEHDILRVLLIAADVISPDGKQGL